MTRPDEIQLSELPRPVSSASQIGTRDSLPALFTETQQRARRAAPRQDHGVPSLVVWCAVSAVGLLVGAATWALLL